MDYPSIILNFFIRKFLMSLQPTVIEIEVLEVQILISFSIMLTHYLLSLSPNIQIITLFEFILIDM